MLGVENYGSDNDSGDDSPLPSTTTATTTTKSSLPPPSSKSSISLPPPSKPKRGPKKIAIGLPVLTHATDDNVDDQPPAKKPRLESGAGSSLLLSMLPAPKRKGPILPEPQERVLGGGKGPGLVFNTPHSVSAAETDIGRNEEEAIDILEEKSSSSSSIPFLPPSLKKGKANISLEETHAPLRAVPPKVSAAPAVDFFQLGGSSPSPSLSRTKSSAPPSSAPDLGSSIIPPSSAPKVEDFTPPEPLPTDPYPGYYLLPSGSWAAYDPTYYQKFYVKWQAEYNAHVRALEKGKEKGFEGADDNVEVNAMLEMEKAKREIQEREEKKALTHGADGAPKAPRMNVKGAKLGGVARSRHQLSTLLTEAYENREALEERIAEGRRNRKEAGNKYGF